MIDIKAGKDCCGCSSCYNSCPKGAITMVEDSNGFLIPKVNKEKCTNCGTCEKVCPILNKNERTDTFQKAYAMYNYNEKIRLQSSSGGIFSLIAEIILNKNGIVFGAKFNDKFEVVHDFIKTKEELDSLRGSKYVQSKIGNTYKLAKEFLENGKYVLFTGTPCQIEGLKKYLKKDYDKLYTQDIICHGVPSPKVWREYLEYQKKINQENIKSISFRNKDHSWSLYRIKILFDTRAYSKSLQEDAYMRAFLENASLRDSCYECNFKKKYRVSDITLADFWRSMENNA